MTGAELKQMIDEFKAQGYSEDDLLAAFYQMYKNDEFDEQDLEVAVNFLGYTLTDEFKNMSDEDKKKLDAEEVEEEQQSAENEDKEDKAMNEDLKTFGEDENQKENEKAEAQPDENKGEETNKEPEKNNEDDERAEARKLFGFDK